MSYATGGSRKSTQHGHALVQRLTQLPLGALNCSAKVAYSHTVCIIGQAQNSRARHGSRDGQAKGDLMD